MCVYVLVYVHVSVVYMRAPAFVREREGERECVCVCVYVVHFYKIYMYSTVYSALTYLSDLLVCVLSCGAILIS